MSESVPNTLIVCADDFGLHCSVNRAIQKAHAHGILTHASLMADGPEFDDAVGIAKNLPTLGVGVHLTLPGNLSGRGQLGLLAECCYYAVRRSYLAEMWRQQIARIVNHGIKPTHLDSHQHTHFFPGIFPVVRRLAEEFDIDRIRWLHFPRSTRNRRAMGALALKCLQFGSLTLHDMRGSNTNLTYSIGFSTSGNLDRENLGRILDIVDHLRVGRSIEIFCHPGDDNKALERDLGWGYDWENELDALCDLDIKSRIEQRERQGGETSR